jgi:type I restriction enzyme S subunit
VIAVPPRAEQDRIVDALERAISVAMNSLLQLELTETRLKGLRTAILSLAFSGRLVRQNPAEEPAAVLLDYIRAERSSKKPRRRSKQLSLSDADE